MKQWLVVFVATVGLVLSATLVVQAQEVCEYEGHPYRPGGTCKETVPYVDARIGDYENTCTSGPEVQINFDSCGYPSGIIGCPNGQGTCMNVETFIDVSNATLGGLGPDENALSLPADFQTQFYPFSALVDKPLDLTQDQPKEAFRTFWRLNSLHSQFNARAKFFQRYLLGKTSSTTNPPIFNSEIPYFPPGGLPEGDKIEEEESSEGDDKYGVNIGYGHIQDNFCELADGKITVILVPLGETNMGQFINCYGGASKLIVRVTGLNPSQTSGELAAAGARIAQICKSVNNCVVEFGNELNNKEVEYPCSASPTSCGATYASQFAAFKSGASGVPVGPAALDIYNSVYPYQSFLTGAAAAYNSGDVAFANVYCLREAGHCDPAGDIATIKAFNAGRDPIITEYGLGPKTTNSMKEWVDWAQDNVPAQEVTLLVPNLCPTTATGDWIHYKNGVVTDLGGARIEPSTCGAGSSVSLKELPTITIEDLYNKLPGCLRDYPVCNQALSAYNGLGEETRIQYDTLLPLSLDNVRGYMSMRYIKADDDETSQQIFGEQLPYVQAIHDLLLQPSYGILQTLSPTWVNNDREILLKGFGDFYTNPLAQESKSYTVIIDRTRSNWTRDKSTNLEGCRDFPKGTTKAAPLTYPRMLQSTEGDLQSREFVQNLRVPVSVTQILENGAPKLCKKTVDGVEVEVPEAFKVEYDSKNSLRDEKLPVQDDIGRSVLVLNNPKMTDISQAISETNLINQNYSLTYSFLPKFAQKDVYEDTPILAKIAEQSNSVDGGDAPDKDIARKDGQAEIDLCEFRNFWLLPSGQHKGAVSQCGDQDTILTSTSAQEELLAAEKTDAKQHLYENSCNGILCYEFIISSLAGGPRCDGKYLNPYVGIAIALNETGGLVSNLTNGANPKHFGCDPYGVLGILPDPVSKYQCMVNTLSNDCRAGKSDAAALAEYNYLPGNNLNNLVDILGGSETCRDGYCFSVFVDQVTAERAASNLRILLPQQQDLWARYYSGYIREFTGE